MSPKPRRVGAVILRRGLESVNVSCVVSLRICIGDERVVFVSELTTLRGL